MEGGRGRKVRRHERYKKKKRVEVRGGKKGYGERMCMCVYVYVRDG